MSWTEVCTVEEIILNSGVAALIKGKQVALFRFEENGEEQITALSNYDPFSKANVISRGIVGCIDGAMTVASPMYKQHFELHSGQCLEDESVALPTWAVKVEAGKVLVSEATEQAAA